MLDAEVQLTYAKDLRNLKLQHTRLCRHCANVLKELNELQEKRKQAVRLQSRRAAEVYFTAINDIRNETEHWKFPELTGSPSWASPGCLFQKMGQSGQRQGRIVFSTTECSNAALSLRPKSNDGDCPQNDASPRRGHSLNCPPPWHRPA